MSTFFRRYSAGIKPLLGLPILRRAIMAAVGFATRWML